MAFNISLFLFLLFLLLTILCFITSLVIYNIQDFLNTYYDTWEIAADKLKALGFICFALMIILFWVIVITGAIEYL